MLASNFLEDDWSNSDAFEPLRRLLFLNPSQPSIELEEGSLYDGPPCAEALLRPSRIGFGRELVADVKGISGSSVQGGERASKPALWFFLASSIPFQK